jgi:hypothetical protein
MLASHAIVAGMIMKKMSGSPLLGIIFALASHFILDALPHSSYKLNSYHFNEKEPLKSVLSINKNFFFDLIKMAVDGLIGLAFLLFLFPANWFWVSLGAFLGALPDFFQFLYLRTKRQPFTTIQKFHLWFHTKSEDEKISFLGIATQIGVILLSLALLG